MKTPWRVLPGRCGRVAEWQCSRLIICGLGSPEQASAQRGSDSHPYRLYQSVACDRVVPVLTSNIGTNGAIACPRCTLIVRTNSLRPILTALDEYLLWSALNFILIVAARLEVLEKPVNSCLQERIRFVQPSNNDLMYCIPRLWAVPRSLNLNRNLGSVLR